jgi:hypothetical protein
MDAKVPDIPYIFFADTIIAFAFIIFALILALPILNKRKQDQNL